MSLLTLLLAGFTGGLLRGIVGIAKSQLTKKNVQLNYTYLAISVLIAGIVGVVAASLAEGDFRFAFLAGYAGSDFLESLLKIKMKEKFEEKMGLAVETKEEPEEVEAEAEE